MNPTHRFLVVIAVVIVGFATSAQAQTVLVDFGGAITTNPTNGNYWNNIWTTGTNFSLVNAANTGTGYWLNLPTNVVMNTNLVPATNGSIPSLGIFNVPTAYSDALYISGTTGTTNTVILGNLNTNQTYDFVIYGARDATTTRATTYTVAGATTSASVTVTNSGTGIGTNGVNFNTSYITISGITPDATTNSGQILVNYAVAAGSFAYLNAMQLTGYVPYTNGLTTNITVAKEYPGATYISNGTTVNANVAGALPTNTRTDLTISGAGSTLALGANQTVASLTGDTNAAVNLNTSSFRVNGSSSTTFAGTISGSGDFAKDGAGTLTLSGSNAMTSFTIVDYGVLNLANSNALANAKLWIYGSASNKMVTFGLAGTNNYNIGDFGGGDGTGILTIGANTITIGASGRSGTSYNGQITGAGGVFVKAGSGTYTLAGSNSYSGGTMLNAGQLNINHASALGTGTFTLANNAKFNNTSGGAISNANNNAIVLGHTNTFSGLSALDLGTGATAISTNGTRLIVSGSGALTLGGNISGTANFWKDGDGTLVLAGSNSMTSLTVIDFGMLSLNHVDALRNAELYLWDNSASRQVVFGVAGANTYNLGALSGNTNASVALGANSLNVGGKNANTTYAGAISGTGGLTKSGTGTFTLSGTNTYGGTTAVIQGTLAVNGNNSAATGSLTVASGAKLSGTGTIGGATTISGIHSPGNSPGVQSFSNGLTYDTGSSITWELAANGLGVRGTDFDGINVTGGALSFSNTTTMNLSFLAPVSWTNSFWAGSYTSTNGWLVYNTSALITGFDSLALSTSWIDSLGNDLAATRPGASFSVYQDTINNDIYLNYAIPEPSTYALLVLAAAGFSSHIVRRRRRK